MNSGGEKDLGPRFSCTLRDCGRKVYGVHLDDMHMGLFPKSHGLQVVVRVRVVVVNFL